MISLQNFIDSLDKAKLDAAIISMGNLYPLKKAFEKAKQKKKLSVAFIGGSITQGFCSSNEKNCWAYLSYLWFCEKFPNAEIEYINAGIGATTSLIGVHRAGRDVLSHSPDMVFVEFAVNDKPSMLDCKAYESLVRRLLLSPNPPAVIELFTSCDDGSNVQEQQISIGKNYHLPMLSYRDLIQGEIKKGNITWKDVSPDTVHPNDLGHKIISTLIGRFLDKTTAADFPPSPSKLLPAPVYGDEYINGEILSSKEVSPSKLEGFEPYEGFQRFYNGWKSPKGQASCMEISIKARHVFLMFKKGISEDSGKVLIECNGEAFEANSFFENGWGDFAETMRLASSEDEKEFKIKITKEDISKEFFILGFLVSK